jgi:hypothetical protein
MCVLGIVIMNVVGTDDGTTENGIISIPGDDGIVIINVDGMVDGINVLKTMTGLFHDGGTGTVGGTVLMTYTICVLGIVSTYVDGTDDGTTENGIISIPGDDGIVIINVDGTDDGITELTTTTGVFHDGGIGTVGGTTDGVII